MNLNRIEETYLRLACCKADTGDGWGELRSLRNHLRAVHREIEEFRPFVEHVRAMDPDDELVTDELTVVIINEYRGLVNVLRAACAFLGEEFPEKIEPKEVVKGETFAEFLERLLK